MPDLEMLPVWAGRIEYRPSQPPMPPQPPAGSGGNGTAAPTDDVPVRPPDEPVAETETDEPTLLQETDEPVAETDADEPTLLQETDQPVAETDVERRDEAPATPSAARPSAAPPTAAPTPADGPPARRLGTLGLIMVALLILAAGVGAGYLYTLVAGG